MSDAIEVVTSFIEAINSQDLELMENLMTIDHTFVDATGGGTSGRDAMISGWKKYYLCVR